MMPATPARECGRARGSRKGAATYSAGGSESFGPRKGPHGAETELVRRTSVPADSHRTSWRSSRSSAVRVESLVRVAGPRGLQRTDAGRQLGRSTTGWLAGQVERGSTDGHHVAPEREAQESNGSAPAGNSRWRTTDAHKEQGPEVASSPGGPGCRRQRQEGNGQR